MRRLGVSKQSQTLSPNPSSTSFRVTGEVPTALCQLRASLYILALTCNFIETESRLKQKLFAEFVLAFYVLNLFKIK